MKILLQIHTELGLMGINISSDYGDSELDALAYDITMEEISGGSASVEVIISTHNSLYLYPVDAFGNNEPKKRQITPLQHVPKKMME